MRSAIPFTLFDPFVRGLHAVLGRFGWIGWWYRPGKVRANEHDSTSDLSEVSHCRGEIVNLPSLAERIAARSQDGSARDIRIDVDVAPDALVVGSYSTLHTLVEALLMEALESTQPGGHITICGEVSDGEVTLRCLSRGVGAIGESQFVVQLPVASYGFARSESAGPMARSECHWKG
jgi:hypothetical protein